MPIKCDRCGIETTIEEAFYRIESRGGGVEARRCPECWSKVLKGIGRRTLVAYAICGIIAALFVWLSEDKTFGFFLTNLLLFYVLMIPVVIPHELGHAFVAKACGCRVYCVTIGFGTILYETTFCGFNLQFKSIPFGGSALWAHRSSVGYRSKQILGVLGGPLANLLLAAATLFIFPEQALNFNVTSGFQPASMFLLGNLYRFVINLWPRSLHRNRFSDGLHLWKTLFLSKKEIAEAPLVYYSLESEECLRERKHENARQILEAGLNLYPGNHILLSNLGVALLYTERFSEARDVFFNVLKQPDLPKLNRCLMLNNIAYTNALIGGEELIKEADRFSDEVLKEIPFVPSYRGTRGTVLVELGRYEEGIALLREAMDKHLDKKSKALNACHIAIAEKRRGNLAACEEFTRIAKKFDPNCTLLKRIEKECRSQQQVT